MNTENLARIVVESPVHGLVVLAHVRELEAELSAWKHRSEALFEEVNAYMCPTAERMSSREGLRQALYNYIKEVV